jgi:hypothetical protein
MEQRRARPFARRDAIVAACGESSRVASLSCNHRLKTAPRRETCN